MQVIACGAGGLLIFHAAAAPPGHRVVERRSQALGGQAKPYRQFPIGNSLSAVFAALKPVRRLNLIFSFNHPQSIFFATH
jgi:hypothetical protein